MLMLLVSFSLFQSVARLLATAAAAASRINKKFGTHGHRVRKRARNTIEGERTTNKAPQDLSEMGQSEQIQREVQQVGFKSLQRGRTSGRTVVSPALAYFYPADQATHPLQVAKQVNHVFNSSDSIGHHSLTARGGGSCQTSRSPPRSSERRPR